MILILFVGSQLADVWTTAYALNRGHTEANAVIRWLMERLGKGWIAAKIGLATLGAYALSLQFGDAGVAVISLVFFGIAFRNWRVVQ